MSEREDKNRIGCTPGKNAHYWCRGFTALSLFFLTRSLLAFQFWRHEPFVNNWIIPRSSKTAHFISFAVFGAKIVSALPAVCRKQEKERKEKDEIEIFFIFILVRFFLPVTSTLGQPWFPRPPPPSLVTGWLNKMQRCQTRPLQYPHSPNRGLSYKT